MQGKIDNIFICAEAGAQTIAKSSVEIIAGEGIVGDRYHKQLGTFSKSNATKPEQQITFIEAEEIDNFNRQYECQLSYGQLRRNVITRNVRLNDLVGKEFKMGDCHFKGIELCEPCAYLAKTVESQLLSGMIGKGGLRTQIIGSGELSVGDVFSFC